MRQFWLVVGTQRNWKIAFENNNIWGLKDFRELRSLWNMLREGDGLLFYVSKPVHGVIGFGHVVTKFIQTRPLWPDELKSNQVLWPLRFKFDIEYCLPPDLWTSEKYTSNDLQLITRMVFQCYPIEEVNAARLAFNLQPIIEARQGASRDISVEGESTSVTHDAAKEYLAKIGQLQGYIADEEYPLDTTRLDVVWRRVERSVPTFVFEVQIGGDIYHAIAKLKHAFDLWNSHIFLVATVAQKAKCQELLSGTFHEIAGRLRFIDVRLVKELFDKKCGYKDMERGIGIFER